MDKNEKSIPSARIGWKKTEGLDKKPGGIEFQLTNLTSSELDLNHNFTCPTWSRGPHANFP
ncbi:hypothetical protein M513_14021 [Trichuris suis]|uniref:Uncharacterized protein n=1 Tax=Trichuris suis TaxID=68888 RepID=A0A085LJF5_9BILA|nr:hypothetical protein M513_14021 [Trichuris suis]